MKKFYMTPEVSVDKLDSEVILLTLSNGPADDSMVLSRERGTRQQDEIITDELW